LGATAFAYPWETWEPTGATVTAVVGAWVGAKVVPGAGVGATVGAWVYLETFESKVYNSVFGSGALLSAGAAPCCVYCIGEK